MNRFLTVTGLISIMLIIGTMFIGCGGSSDPSSVVKAWFTAVEKKDENGIRRHMTKESADMLIPFLGKAEESISELGGIKSTKEKIDGDTAVVTVTYGNGDTEDIHLVKVDGSWKVSIDK